MGARGRTTALDEWAARSGSGRTETRQSPGAQREAVLTDNQSQTPVSVMVKRLDRRARDPLNFMAGDKAAGADRRLMFIET